MKKQITFAIAAMLMLASCSEKQVIDQVDPIATGDAINFTTSIVDVKGTPVEGVDMKLDFGTFGYHNKTGNYLQGNLVPDLMFNRHIRFNSSGNCHEYSPTMYWPREGNVNFFAYSPYKAVNTFETPLNNSSKGYPCLNYTVSHTNIANHEDLMFSQALKQDKDCGQVTLHFKHALTKVGVYAYLAENCDDYEIEITKVYLTNIKTSGCFDFSRFEGQYRNWWDTKDSPSQTYTFGLKDNGGVEVKYSNNESVKYHTQINANNQFLLAMPQEIAKNAKLVVEYEITMKNNHRDADALELDSYGGGGYNNVEKHTAEFLIEKSVECWIPCEFVAFDLKFSLSECEMRATLCDWELHEVNLEVCD